MDLYGAIDYRLAMVDVNNSDEIYSTFGGGGGLNLTFNRFKTVNLSYSAEIMNYRQDDFNNISGVRDDADFLTFNNKEELSAYFDQEKRSGVFARGLVVNELGSEAGDAFFQFQVGVTFSLGFQKVAAK